jgi:hypothetical protein
VTSTGPFTYGPGLTSQTAIIYPAPQQYSLCFENTAGNLSGYAATYVWSEASGTANMALIPYYLTSPLPNPYNSSGLAVYSGTTFQMWMTLTAPSQVQYFVYALQGGNATAGTAYTVCANGQMVTSGYSSGSYSVYNITGQRVYVDSTGYYKQAILGLALRGTDGNDATISTIAPYVDGGGVTYVLDSYAKFPPGASGTLGYATNAFINLYASGSTVTEDGYGSAPAPSPIGVGIVMSFTTPLTCASLGLNLSATTGFTNNPIRQQTTHHTCTHTHTHAHNTAHTTHHASHGVSSSSVSCHAIHSLSLCCAVHAAVVVQWPVTCTTPPLLPLEAKLDRSPMTYTATPLRPSMFPLVERS